MDPVDLHQLCLNLTVEELLERSRVTLRQFHAARQAGRYRKSQELQAELDVLRPHLWSALRALLLEEAVAQAFLDDLAYDDRTL